MRKISARWMALPANTRAGLWMVLTSVGFALGLVAVRMLAPRFSPEQILFFRAALPVLVLTPLVGRAGLAAFRGRAAVMSIACGAASAVALAIWNWALPLIPLADATALNFTLPLFTVILAAMFLGERIGLERAVVTGVGFCGVLIILRPGFQDVGLPALSVLGNALLFAVAAILIRVLAQVSSSWVVLLNFSVVMALTSFGASLATGWIWPGRADLFWVVGVGVFGFMSYVGVIRTLAIAEAGVYAGFDFLRMPAATLVAVFWFGEPIDPWTWAGALIIVASSIYNARLGGRPQSPPP